MVRLRTVILLLSMLVLAPVSVHAEVVEHGGHYLPGMVGVVAIWCSSEPHAIVPVGDPEEYSSPIGWLVSGEPECAPADAMNVVREAQGEGRVEVGIGGFAWIYDLRHIWTNATAWTDDEVTGAHTYMHLISYSDEYGDSEAEGCGPQTVTLMPPSNPWGQPQYTALLWAWLPEAGVDADLDFCFSTTGTITARYGA